MSTATWPTCMHVPLSAGNQVILSTYIAGIDGERVTSDLHPPLYPRLTSNVAYEKREREVSSHVS